ncbi:MAG: hypothetical protein IT302_08495 [Dehalococcoidia bacterium]|nr:hypothetical protein [Dehalococcoidia bacterium]
MGTLYFPAFDDFDLNDRELALTAYFTRLEFIAPKLKQELNDTLLARKACNELEATLQGEFDAMVAAAFEHAQVERPQPGGIGRITLPLIYTPGAAAAELRMEAFRLQAESAAGALMLMLDEVVQRLRHETGAPTTGEAPYPRHASEFVLGTLGAKDNVSTLIYAAGNAYRHAKDWEGLVNEFGILDQSHHEYAKARRTLDILSCSIDLVQVFRESTCIASVERLTGDDVGRAPFTVLWDRLHDVGRDYANTYASGVASLDKAVSALDAQHDYAMAQVSFSGDDQLWDDAQFE